MIVLQALAVTVGLAMIAATAVPILRAEPWWIRIFDFPRLQILVLLVLAGLAYLPFAQTSAFSYVFLAALVAALGYQAYMMFPYTPFAGKQVQASRHAAPESSVTVLFANVLMKNRQAARLKEMIQETDPDLVLAVETDAWWHDQLRYLRATHPYAVEHPQDNTYGMLVYSRLALIDPEVKFLMQDDVPSIHTRLRLRNGVEVELRCVHPRPPGPNKAQDAAVRDAELLLIGRGLKKLRERQERPAAAIVLGDLNDVAWSRTTTLFQAVSGLLDPRIGRGIYATFHARYPFLRYPLDHCFHSDHFRLASFRRLPAFGSDHFPVCIRLSYEPAAVARQPRPRASPEQQQVADDKVARAVGTRFASHLGWLR